MPRGEGTGPMGMGAMTGRAAGFCAGSGMAGYANKGQGRGAGGAGIMQPAGRAACAPAEMPRRFRGPARRGKNTT